MRMAALPCRVVCWHAWHAHDCAALQTGPTIMTTASCHMMWQRAHAVPAAGGPGQQAWVCGNLCAMGRTCMVVVLMLPGLLLLPCFCVV